MMPDIKIIVCYHKPGKYISNEVYVPVHVGKATSKYNLPIQGDNEGENISSLNYTYCELTGLYWAWKNIKADYIGLCHYRRFFTFEKSFIHGFIHRMYATALNAFQAFVSFPKSYSSLQEIIVNNEDALVKKALKEADKIKNYIRNHNDAKIIALRPMSMGLTNIVTHFSTVSGAHHIEIVKNIVKSKYPSIYPSFESVIFSNKLHLGNMIICEKSVFNQYCSFVFSVLEEHRRILIEDGWYKDLKEYSISRLSGYIAEILTSVFVSYIEKTEGRRFVKLLTLLRAKI